MTVEPPLPMNWALFVFQFVDVRDENAMLLTTVFAPPPVVIVSLTADVVRPVGVVDGTNWTLLITTTPTGLTTSAGGRRRNQQRPVRSVAGSPDVDTHHTRSL